MAIKQNSGKADEDFERLKLRIRRYPGIPTPSGASMRLLELLKNPNASVRDFEAIVSGEPSLASALIRSADADSHFQSTHVTLREMIMRLGTRGLRSLAWAVSSFMINRIPGFVDGRFARHSHAVAFLSKYLFARKVHKKPDAPTRWTSDEIYVMGLVHDMSYPLLAMVAPDIHHRVLAIAKRTESTVSDAFQQVFGQPMTVLSPEIFASQPSCEELHRAISLLHEPWNYKEEYESLCCVVYADYLATGPFELATEDWKVSAQLPAEITEADQLAEEELDVVFEALELHFENCSKMSSPRGNRPAA